MKFTEEQLKQFAAHLSKTEDQQCQNTIGMVHRGEAYYYITEDD